jgi:flagellar hook-basal body complex protein FliE
MHDLRIVNNSVPHAASAGKPRGEATSSDKTFGAILKDNLKEVHKLQTGADRAIANVMVNNTGSIHEAMIAMEKAGIAFQATVSIRNKILEAYQEVMRMQV